MESTKKCFSHTTNSSGLYFRQNAVKHSSRDKYTLSLSLSVVFNVNEKNSGASCIKFKQHFSQGRRRVKQKKKKGEENFHGHFIPQRIQRRIILHIPFVIKKINVTEERKFHVLYFIHLYYIQHAQRLMRIFLCCCS